MSRSRLEPETYRINTWASVICSFVVVDIIIIIILGISFMQSIYAYAPETNHVPREHRVAAILVLLFMVLTLLVPALLLLLLLLLTQILKFKFKFNILLRDFY